MREIVYELINGNPNYDKKDKPQNAKKIYRISDDKEDKSEKKVVEKVTEQDIRVMEALNFKPNGTIK